MTACLPLEPLAAQPRGPAFDLEPDELVLDYFAGGGGTSSGLDDALEELGRHVDFAINHDPEAIAMHRANHPRTHHVCGDVWDVNPRELCAGRRVGLAWFSPDCQFFSKARGKKPFRDPRSARGRRGLAWVVVRCARTVRPRVLIMENVEEFADWGPVLDDGRPCPARRGLTFRRWVGNLRAAGYQVEWRELRACDYGAPTIRKRLFVIARCDGKPIVWPEPTHGPGRQPYRTAAECIDWTIPCPSIFERKKPLAEKTLRRIARGIQRYVIDAREPFIVPATHGDGAAGEDQRVHSVREPLRTVTTRGAPFHVVQPFIAPVNHGGDDRVHSIAEPLRTVTAAPRGEHAVVAAALTKYHGGTPRAQSLDEPTRTLDTANRFGLVAASLVRTAHGDVGRNGSKRRGRGEHDIETPLPTTCTSRDLALVGATLVQTGYGERPGQAPRVPHLDKPLGTVVGDQKHALVAAFLAKHNGGHEATGSRLPDPVGTVTTKDHHALAAVHMLKLHGSCADGQPIDQPAPTVRAKGTHLAEVRAFLTRYNGEGDGQPLDAPLGTVTTKDRFGVVVLHGQPYQIVDIGMRMLAPRELFNAQSFAPDYTIELCVRDRRGRMRRLTKTAQVRMCGNSVPPKLARALATANLRRAAA